MALENKTSTQKVALTKIGAHDVAEYEEGVTNKEKFDELHNVEKTKEATDTCSDGKCCLNGE